MAHPNAKEIFEEDHQLAMEENPQERMKMVREWVEKGLPFNALQQQILERWPTERLDQGWSHIEYMMDVPSWGLTRNGMRDVLRDIKNGVDPNHILIPLEVLSDIQDQIHEKK